MNDAIFRPEALAYHERRLEGAVLLTRPLASWVLIVLLTGILVIIASALVFVSYAPVHNVQGAIVPDVDIVELRAPSNGVILSIDAEIGRHLSKNQPVATIGRRRDLIGGEDSLAQRLERFRLEQRSLADSRAILNAKILKHRDELSERMERVAALQAVLEDQIHAQQSVVLISQKLTDKYRQLLNEEAGAELEWNQSLQALRRQEVALGALERERIKTTDELLAIKNATAEKIEQARQEIAEIDRRIFAVERNEKELRAQWRSAVVSPVSGTLVDLAFRQGQPIVISDRIARVVPDGANMSAEFDVSSQTIAALREGQGVRVEIKAFPASSYGFLRAHVMSLSSISLDENNQSGQELAARYRVVIGFEEAFTTSKGTNLADWIKIGMEVNADFIGEKCPLWRYLFKNNS